MPDLLAYGQIKAPATEVLMAAAERWAGRPDLDRCPRRAGDRSSVGHEQVKVPGHSSADPAVDACGLRIEGDAGPGRQRSQLRSQYRSVVGDAWRHDPLGGLAGERGDHVEVAVVVEDGQPVQFRCGGDEKVGE